MNNATGTDDAGLLSHLHADLSARWGQGERARVEEYLARYPHLGESPEAVVALVYAELMLAEAEGEVPTLSGYQARFPQHAEAIERQWRLHELIRTHTLQPIDGDATTAQGPAAPPGPGALPAAEEGPFPGLVLVGELGRGAMGDVQKAWQPALDRFVAVKTIRAGRDGEAALAARFRTEARAVGRLRHPGIVQVFDFGEAGGCLYLVMEYLPGGSLARELKGGPLAPERAARTVEALARAVHAAHEAGVIHRDLKPANVLLTADGQPKVGDFGVARLLDDEGQTMAGLAVGTPSYMSPEQTRGQVGRATDVWALGVILYECLAGRRPFNGEDQPSLLRSITEHDPVPPHPEGAETPAGLVAICRACLRKRPEDRYATAGALADDLERWLAGQAVRPPAPEWTRRAVLGAGVAATVGGVGAWFAFVRGEPQAPEVKKTPREEAEELLRQGQPFVFKGDEPLPGPFQPILAGAGPPVPVPADRCFSVETVDRALVELITPPCDRYRFSVQVRHDSAGATSAVGVFCAYREVQIGRDKRQGAFFSLTFDERSGEARMSRDKLGRPISKVRWTSHFFEEVSGKQPLVTEGPGGGAEKPFQPTLPLREGPWRWLEVLVTPEAISASWEHNRKGVEVIGRLKQSTVEALLKASKLVLPQFAVVPNDYGPRAMLGLYVRSGKASYRRIVIAPLTGEA